MYDDRVQGAVKKDPFSDRFVVLGNRLNVLFWLSIATVICSFVESILSRSGGGAAYILVVILIGLSIARAGVIVSLSSISDTFRTAGICYVIYTVCDRLGSFASQGIYILLSLGSLVCSLIFFFSFYPELAFWMDMTDPYLAENWRLYMKFEIAAVIASFSTLLFILFGLFSLAAILLLIIAVAVLVLGIVELVLLHKSVYACFSYTPREKESHASQIVPNYSNARNSSGRTPAADEWKCTCGRINPNFTPICSCGTKKSQAKVAFATMEENTRKAQELRKAKTQQSNEQETIRLLKEYKELLDSGVLSQEEFDQKKAELLK